MNSREQRLMPDGVPRYVRCYDGGEDLFDRYTVVCTVDAGLAKVVGSSSTSACPSIHTILRALDSMGIQTGPSMSMKADGLLPSGGRTILAFE